MFMSMNKYDPGQKLRNSMLVSFGLVLIMETLATILWTANERTINRPVRNRGWYNRYSLAAALTRIKSFSGRPLDFLREFQQFYLPGGHCFLQS